MGQSARKEQATKQDGPAQLVSLDNVKARASNAAVVNSRYHWGDGRKLEDNYEISATVLGQGLCGDVVQVLGRTDRRNYALKRVRKQQMSRTKIKELVDEVEIYLALDHPNIARLHDVYETPLEFCLVTECCKGGELYFRLNSRGTYTEPDAAEATRQMLRAVGFLHAHSVVHRDLKLENFLYESEEDSAQLKLIDFGFAKIWDRSTLMMASCGSIAYVAPDVLSGRGYTSKCDLWSLGVIVWMLLSGYPPFHGDEKSMLAKIKAGEPDWSHRSRWQNVSQQAQDFVGSLLMLEPHMRPDAKAALKHPWLDSTPNAEGAKPLPKTALRSLRAYAESSKIRRAMLQLLAQELGPEETKELRNAFFDIDKGNQGTVSVEELKQAIRSSGSSSPKKRRPRLGVDLEVVEGEGLPISPTGSIPPGPMTPATSLKRAPDQVLDELLSQLASHGDAQIYYSDFLAATMQVRNELREEAVRATFARLDMDGSGSISVADLRGVVGETFEGADAEELVREVASEGGGRGITYDAFLQVLQDRDEVPISPESSYGISSWVLGGGERLCEQ